MYVNLFDSHVHSDCSFDGTDPVMMICERAAALGLYSIAVTDHCECDIYYKEGFDRSVVQSFFETRKARAVFYGRLQVYAGIELGQPITDPKATREALSAGAFDFVLASVHNLPGQKDFYYLNYTDENVDPLLSDYFDHVLQVAKWGQFDSLRLTEKIHLADPGRLVDHASGWFDQGGGDVKSVHNYFRPLRVRTEQRPFILSEYGGYSCPVDGHLYSTNSFGYHTYKDTAEFTAAWQALQKKIQELQDKGLAGAVYTQLSDVEEETNGLYTYDRKVCKVERKL